MYWLEATLRIKRNLVTQLFFGECYQVLQKEGNLLQIQIASDNYVGWIDFKQHFLVTDEYFLEWITTQHPRILNIVQTVSSIDKATFDLLFKPETLPFYARKVRQAIYELVSDFTLSHKIL